MYEILHYTHFSVPSFDINIDIRVPTCTRHRVNAPYFLDLEQGENRFISLATQLRTSFKSLGFKCQSVPILSPKSALSL